jgi:hypothetical protein
MLRDSTLNEPWEQHIPTCLAAMCRLVGNDPPGMTSIG